VKPSLTFEFTSTLFRVPGPGGWVFRRVRLLPFVAALSLWAAEDASAQDATAHVAAAQVDGWTIVHPEGDSGCAFGTPFRFFHREGADPSRLLVWFQGGGACWNWVSCSGMFDTSVDDDELAGYGGIFDFEHPDNPFREYTVVFVPYCTGDVHLGDTIVRYGDESWDTTPVQHRGANNVAAVLDWMRVNVPAPERLVVSGASAGSYGALFHAPALARLFPDARLVFIGDSGVPLLHDYPGILAGWGADPDLTLEAAHERMARLRPNATLAQITTDDDAIQKAFYIFSGSGDWRGATLGLLAGLEASVPRFHAFVVTGEDHGLMRVDAFHGYEADGVRLRDWIDDLVNGRPVESRYCDGCVAADGP